MSDWFEHEILADGQELRIAVRSSKLDATMAASFGASVDEVWRDSIRKVSFDFGQIEFIDSSGIGAMVRIQKRLMPTKGIIEIHNGSASVLTVIETLRLHRVFKIIDTGSTSKRA